MSAHLNRDNVLAIANTFGAIEIGSIIAIFLFGIITLQAYVYFTNFDEDHLAFRALLGLTISVLYELYRITIVMYGEPGIQTMKHPALGVIVILGAFISTTIHFFYSYHLWTIIPKPFNFAGVFTAVAAFVRCILTIWGGVREIKAPDYATFLAGMRPWILSRDSRFIDRLITSPIVTIAVLILVRNLPLIFFAVYATLSKWYTNTLLTGLNARPSLKESMVHAPVSVDVVRKRDRFARTSGGSSSIPQYNNAISIAMKTTTECKMMIRPSDRLCHATIQIVHTP
ncbi:hypothetical protein BJ912DRAFT_992869 [Pholiota molesta]|nr:hypothetical protein BJ912DRAFT_992869 [Pholiota molesta]